jgi:hypothetical protein
VIDDSEGLVTPREAFCRILEVMRPENPGLGKTVTGPHWIYEDRDEADTLACQNAIGFLEANVSAGKIRAQGIRKGTEHDGPKPIDTAELRTGILKIWDGTLECRGDGFGRLYRSVFLSMADINRELGLPPVTGTPTRLKPASDPRIRTEIKAAYADAKNQNVKPPHIVELGKIVQGRLATAGLYAAQAHIQEIGGEDEFLKLRRAVGKTIASER